jgi:hypothetical protein
MAIDAQIAINQFHIENNMELIGLIVVMAVIFGGLYFVGSLFNKEGYEDYRFGALTNVVYGCDCTNHCLDFVSV